MLTTIRPYTPDNKSVTAPNVKVIDSQLRRNLFIFVPVVRKAQIPSSDQVRPHRRTLNKALGLLATDRPPPTDEEVQQWLDEHRMEKYG